MAKFPTYEEMAKNVAEKALDNFEYQGKTIREWMKIITEQEPCEDAVSCKAVKELLDDYYAELTLDEKALESNATAIKVTRNIINDIESLPHVTPKSETVTEFADRCRECGARYGKLLKQKTGYWKYIGNGHNGLFECDNCGAHRNVFNELEKYCYACGAKMIELQGSEVQE